MGELVSLIEPNGAGKTTLMRAISGLVLWEKQMAGDLLAISPSPARFTFWPADRSAAAAPDCPDGTGALPERRRPFSELTVAENLGRAHR